MPELPEVETLRRSLLPKLVGRTITGLEVHKRDLRMNVPTRKLRQGTSGQRIVDLHRRAKYLLILLENERYLLVHLGMTGRLFFRQVAASLEDHVHVVFRLDRRAELRFQDPRRFGLVDLVPVARLERDRRFCDLGPEPLSDGCSSRYFFERSRGLKKPIKNFLMDAHHVVGVGNIYASEALFDARIHPQRAAGRLGIQSWQRLTASVKKVLGEAIRQGGTTINDFQDGNGNEGYFQVLLQVYGKEGEACSRCGRTLRMKVLAGRSTFYCPGCQR